MFATRLATAVVLIAAFTAALYGLPAGWWMALLLPVLAVASWEWSVLAGFGLLQRRAFTGIVLVSALLAGYVGASAAARHAPTIDLVVYAVSGAFWVLLAVPWLALGCRVKSRSVMGLTGWILLVPTWLALARLQADPGQLLALLGIIWVSDTAAYLAGKAWGKHKLAPAISPGKTWEGAAGAAVAVAVYYVALSVTIPEWSWWKGPGGVVLFAGVALAGVLGDLFESWIKRQAGAKDSGSLLPGHGGVLDRVDSMTAGLPIAALLLPYAR